mgnify:CR=1 FL=1
MHVELQNISKHFYYNWSFKDLDYTFEGGKWHAITGRNGSGKSTLLQVISSFRTPSKGHIHYAKAGKAIPVEDVYAHLTLATPHLDLLEEFSLEEHLQFQATFKSLKANLDIDTILDLTGLKPHRHKAIKYFSSGMLQRLRLAQAIYFQSSLLLLDEPTSHLDRAGIEWYKQTMLEYCQDQCVIISSNVKEDYEFCPNVLDVEAHKPEKA